MSYLTLNPFIEHAQAKRKTKRNFNLTYSQAKRYYLSIAMDQGERLYVGNMHQLPYKPYAHRMVKDGLFVLKRLSKHHKTKKTTMKSQTILDLTDKGRKEYNRLAKIKGINL